MAKFYGNIGYGISVESPVDSGIWIDEITEFPYYGDVIRKTSKSQSGENLNDDITIGNSISVVANEYAVKNFSAMKYIRWEGTLWKIDSVDVQSPRLVLNLGSVYNGPIAPETD